MDKSLIRVRGTKKHAKIIVGLLLLFFLSGLTLHFWGSVLHHQTINNKIESIGGKILSIQDVVLEETPFLKTMLSRKGKRNTYPNTFYKVVYEKDRTKFIAWYRGVNGPFMIHSQTVDRNNNAIVESLENAKFIKNYGESWIFTKP